MFDNLKTLCMLDGTSGNEESVRQFVIESIKDYCEYKTDALGNLICYKKGKNGAKRRIVVDAHLDEVGIIVTGITNDGFLRFTTVGSVETDTLLCERVRFSNGVYGVIGTKPVHLCSGDEQKSLPDCKNLYIDIGAKSKQEAESIVSIGQFAVICGEYIENEGKIISKALDDRVGCAVLIDLIKNFDEYDFYGCFSVQEEVGIRGAKTAAYGINPHSAIILEGTTAADIPLSPEDKKVCILGNGVAVSFMDRATVYDKEYFNAALNSKIKVQIKSAATGGNNAGSYSLNMSGTRVIALSVPCRYIHSPSSVADKGDIESMRELAGYMLEYIAEKEV